MVEIDDSALAAWVIEMAREWGEYGEVHDTAYEGQYGQHEYETGWSIADLDPDDCMVRCDDRIIEVSGMVDAEYSVQVARAKRYPPGKAHPAEYERRSIPLLITIRVDMTEPPLPIIDAETG